MTDNTTKSQLQSTITPASTEVQSNPSNSRENDNDIIISRIAVITLIFAGAVTVAEGPGDHFTFVETFIGLTMLIVLFSFYSIEKEKLGEKLAFSATFAFASVITIGILLDLLYYGILEGIFSNWFGPPDVDPFIGYGIARSLPVFIAWLIIGVACFLVREKRGSKKRQRSK